MSAERFFIINKKPAKGDAVSLGADESRHLAKVTRARPGEEVNLIDGEGGIYRAVVREIRGAVSLEVIDAKRAEPAFPVDMAIPLLKANRMDYAVEKCAETGIRRIIPFHSQRSVWRGGRDAEERKIARMERKVEAACKQSGNPWFTRIGRVSGLRELSALFGGYERVLVAGAEGFPCVELEAARGLSSLGVVGPEGGFTYDERELLKQGGAIPVSLGHTRLRSETAVAFLAWFMISSA